MVSETHQHQWQRSYLPIYSATQPPAYLPRASVHFDPAHDGPSLTVLP